MIRAPLLKAGSPYITHVTGTGECIRDIFSSLVVEALAQMWAEWKRALAAEAKAGRVELRRLGREEVRAGVILIGRMGPLQGHANVAEARWGHSCFFRYRKAHDAGWKSSAGGGLLSQKSRVSDLRSQIDLTLQGSRAHAALAQNWIVESQGSWNLAAPVGRIAWIVRDLFAYVLHSHTFRFRILTYFHVCMAMSYV